MSTSNVENNEYSGSTQGGGMLYGVSVAGLLDAFPDLDLPMTYESLMPLVVGGVACMALAWVLVLRKRLAKAKLIASTQSERYRQFFDSCPDALLVVEEDGSIVSANPNACKLLQMELPDLLAHTCWNFIDKVSMPEVRKRFQPCLTGKSMHCVAGIQTSDGSVTPVDMHGSLQRIAKKNLVQLYLRDKSVQLETEAQVHSLYKQLDEATAALGEKEAMLAEQIQSAREELISSLNHQIRTPLNGIMGMGQLLSDTALRIDQHNYVNMILNSSSSLLKVVDSMGKTLGIYPEETESQAGLADMRALCEELSRSYKLLAIQKGIDFRCDCQDNVPAQVAADEKLLGQVLSGLLDNAFRFTRNGLVMLNIECRRQSTEEAELHFQIIDTGMDVDEELQAPVPEASATGIEPGLGWAACMQVVKQMGGTLNHINTMGKGSTVNFTLAFPLAVPRSDTSMNSQLTALNEPSPSSIEGARILVVDDNKVSQKVVVAMLQKAGARVSIAGNGQEALYLIREKPIDVVLMDCHMPVMDGYTATARIRAMSGPHHNLPIIALTAHSLKHELQACLDSGMDDCLVKPVDRQKLIDTVTRYISESRAHTSTLKAS